MLVRVYASGCGTGNDYEVWQDLAPKGGLQAIVTAIGIGTQAYDTQAHQLSKCRAEIQLLSGALGADVVGAALSIDPTTGCLALSWTMNTGAPYRVVLCYGGEAQNLDVTYGGLITVMGMPMFTVGGFGYPPYSLVTLGAMGIGLSNTGQTVSDAVGGITMTNPAADMTAARNVIASQGYVQATTGLRPGGAGGPTITAGNGDPGGVVNATVGSLFLRMNGAAGSSLYVCEVAPNTWAAK